MLQYTANHNIPKIITGLRRLIETGNFPNNRELLEVCKANCINLIETKTERHRVHDLLETAINLYLFNRYGDSVKEDKYTTLEELENFQNRLPTQSWRDDEQITFQQFSTPPALGYVMAQFLKLKKISTAIEPSAGTGSLANWLKIAGCLTEVNEISARRRLLLEIQRYRPHDVNAEFLDDLLDQEIKPDFVLMNPPFSSTGGRTKKNDSSVGFRHIESALSRLKAGGRLVCLLGAESCLKTDKGKLFWNRIGVEFNIRLFLVVPKNAFYKYGTTFQTIVVIIDKPSAGETASTQKITRPQTIEFCSLKEMLQFSEVFNSTNL